MVNKIFQALPLMLAAGVMCSPGNAAELKSPMLRSPSSTVKAGPTAAIIPCPNKLSGVNISIDSQYSAPSGWTGKMTPTGYQNQTLIISYHSVLSGKLNCTYAQTSLPSSYRLTTISRPVPAGKTCTAIEGFKFSCN